MAEADTTDKTNAPDGPVNSGDVQLEQSTYEIIRNRLNLQSAELSNRLDTLHAKRRDVFGAIETKLLTSERITTGNNCVARDVVSVGDFFVFGYNVHIGLKSETGIADVFSIYTFSEGTFHEASLERINDGVFVNDFKQLYKYYKDTSFTKFFVRGPHLYMVFQIGKSASDIKAFKWLIADDNLKYVDCRSDHEVTYPPQHDFDWQRTHRDLHRPGVHPHISIEDRIFVETVGGDLTIKVEDNTEQGEGIYSEPVDDPDQTLDDADIFYAVVENIILLKMRPYQENEFRYLVYNEKIQKVHRLDAIEDACVMLPEGHGLIFSNGYYLQTGHHKTFESSLNDLLFEKRISSPNGEDHLFVFFNRESGSYVLLSYNVIDQRVQSPVVCHGFSLFDNGHMLLFRADHDQPQKHHAVQIWQTPYVGENYTVNAKTDSYLFKIGNKDLVRGMAECHEIIDLVAREDTYANLYVDLVKRSGDILDSYFWLDQDETFNLGEILRHIRAAATSAVDEFDKVVRVRQQTKQASDDVSKKVQTISRAINTKRFEHIDDFVTSLTELRHVRGEIISLRELRYVDLPAVEELESRIVDQTEKLSHRSVGFLLKPESLSPYMTTVELQRSQIDDLAKVAEAKKLEEEIVQGSADLEMLIDVVSNLKIDDATQRTEIIDNISAIYSKLNQTRAALKKKNKELLSVEGEAEFGSQIKLLGQAVVNYLDVCDTPQKCDDYLTKIMVQIEELEGRFAEFDDFVLQLTEKREEVYAAFDGRKVSLVEARNKRATSLQSAAERILKGIETRVRGLEEINEIHSYFASDLMVDKVREIVEQLTELEDTVKVDDIQSQLKTIREDSVRQLKDRQELFEGGKNVIRLGKHRFSVNTQELDLTTVRKDGQMCFHLAGTNFLEPILDEAFLDTEEVWTQSAISENEIVYRAEYLAYKMLQHLRQANCDFAEMLQLDESAFLAEVQTFMGPRHAEGYVKGVHDHDAALLLRALIEIESSIGMLRFSSSARALASVFCQAATDFRGGLLHGQLRGLQSIRRVFPMNNGQSDLTETIEQRIGEFATTTDLFDPQLAGSASRFLFAEMTAGDALSTSQSAVDLYHAFRDHLKNQKSIKELERSVKTLEANPAARFNVFRNWVSAFVEQQAGDFDSALIDEVASLLLQGGPSDRHLVLTGSTQKVITGLVGDHPTLKEKSHTVDFVEFFERLERFERETEPKYRQYQQLKHDLVERKRNELRLDEFKPRVLTSFVRNKLIDEIYLPLIGDNLAKQMGVVGEHKRTDLMGLLLLISPPGYGKTTLMEYVANRLGITFMKINGPAIGHQVTSLDPNEAPNASSREEIEKLNLSLEMGDNVMIYLDDIQHCNPEFLQKFISLCDGQRKIEGVYQGRTRTYDLRGRKVCVVMAGNPYTESGAKFQIPDMLSNRADTYNLGDVIGDSLAAFESSYLENSLTSNPALAKLASRSQEDVYAIIKMAQHDSPEGIELEGNYSVEELNEFASVMRKLMRIRDVLLKVNDQYIRSAAQADDYRTEPPFKLQGSYRDMNKMAERVVPIMNDSEVESLIVGHFENQAQTLTTGAEANLLKFRELLGTLSETEAARWEEIKKTFQRNVFLGSTGGDDKFAQVVAQMTLFSEGLADIRNVLTDGLATLSDNDSEVEEATAAESPLNPILSDAVSQLSEFKLGLTEIKHALMDGVTELKKGPAVVPPASPSTTDSAPQEPTKLPIQQIQLIHKVPKVFLDVIKAQFAIMQSWLEPMLKMSQASKINSKQLKANIDETFARYDDLIKKMESAAGKKSKRKS